jgi:3-dehydroquinate synthetase
MPAASASFRFRSPGEPSETEVVVGAGAFADLGRRLPGIAQGRWFVVSSRPVFRRHGAALVAGAAGSGLDPDPLLVPDGEKAKSWEVLGRLLQTLVSRGLKRDGGVIALGGGTVGDVGGLAASLALRGVALVQAPTTLLAASDSALGGKTAVDLTTGKNLAGTFHQPRLILVDTKTLATLPGRAYRSGLAEVVKSAFLDRVFHKRLETLTHDLEEREPGAVSEAVYRSLRLKARVVASDPGERRGRRVFLNLGHTVGHALETASGHRLTHGEAVAWGLLAALVLSEQRVGLRPSRARDMAHQVAFLCRPPRLDASTRYWPAFLSHDKKSDRMGLVGVLLSAPGRPVAVRMEAAELEAALLEAQKRYNGRITWR